MQGREEDEGKKQTKTKEKEKEKELLVRVINAVREGTSIKQNESRY